MNSNSSLPFPDDLMVEILIRLPIKPLFRFKCVGKQWQALISSHPSLVLRNTTGFYVMVNSTKASQSGNTKFINLHPNGFIMSSSSDPVIDMNLSFIQQSFIIVDSNNGFLLLRDDDDDIDKEQPFQYFVCNPITKQCILLPKPKYRNVREKASLFCYKNDNADQHHIDFQVTCYHRSVTEIYSSETRLWIESRTSLMRNGRRVYLNKYVYWLEKWSRASILFSSKDGGIYGGIRFPCAKNSTYYEQLLGVSGESLYFADSNNSRFIVWHLVNGVEWCLKHHITFKKVIYPEVNWITTKHPFVPLAFHPLNYQLVLVVMNNRLVIYRMDEKRIELVDELQDEIFPDTHNLPVFPFSLAAWSTCTPCIKDT